VPVWTAGTVKVGERMDEMYQPYMYEVMGLPEPATEPSTKGWMGWGVYNPSDKFREITQMVAVCRATDMLVVALCGPAGDKASEQDAEFICRAVNEYDHLRAEIDRLNVALAQCQGHTVADEYNDICADCEDGGRGVAG
jgi:hypothetical protein